MIHCSSNMEKQKKKYKKSELILTFFWCIYSFIYNSGNIDNI